MEVLIKMIKCREMKIYIRIHLLVVAQIHNNLTNLCKQAQIAQHFKINIVKCKLDKWAQTNKKDQEQTKVSMILNNQKPKMLNISIVPKSLIKRNKMVTLSKNEVY